MRHAARASPLEGGGFLLGGLDADAPAIARRFDQPLVGREQERNHLRDTFARVAAQRSPELLTVLGEPGIGKSRLVAELTAIAGADGTVLTGHCRPYGEGITMWPLREAVAQARGDLSADKLAAALGIPAIAVRRVAAAVGLEDGEPGEDTEWAFLQLVGALARVRPLVIVVDDAHWAEPALLDLLLELVARLRHTPLLVVWVARPDLLEHAGERLERGECLTLRPLSAGASASLLATIGGGRLPPAEQRQVAEAAGGNPLFLEQLMAYVGERHEADELPPALQALLTARLDRLDAAERAALALGAVAGDTFNADRSTRWPPGSHRLTSSALANSSWSATCSSAARAAALCASGTRSSATSPTPRWRSRRGRACTSGTPPGSQSSAPIWRRPTRGSASTSRPRAGSRRRSAVVLRRSLRTGPGSGSPPRRSWPTPAATSPARSASSIAPWRCLATTARRAPRCCRRSSPRCSSRERPTGPRRWRTAPCR